MTKIYKFLTITSILFFSSFLLSACGKKIEPKTPAKTIIKTLQQTEFTETEKPIISLIPRADGHEFKLKIENIPQNITQIEYELLYTATDNNLEIEKGVGDTIKLESRNIERDLLLGTASCTNGCKYKYDEGINKGTLSLTFITANNQVVSYESPFVLTTSEKINKNSGITSENNTFSIKATTTTRNDFFVLIKNFKNFYSVFSNGAGSGKIISITPDTITKENKATLIGDYLIQ